MSSTLVFSKDVNGQAGSDLRLVVPKQETFEKGE